MDIDCLISLLRQQHQKIEAEVKKLQRAPASDSLEIRKLKKNKLSLKDKIRRLSFRLMPNARDNQR